MNIHFRPPFERSFGTFPLKGQQLAAAFEMALDVGYRAFDTAQMYENEADVGKALRTARVRRDELCITTKVSPENFAPDRFLRSVEESLERLQLDCVDVLLLHWPPPGEDVAGPLKLLEAAARQGLAKHIGVSNFTATMMARAHEVCETPLVTNQVEFHPLLDQSKLLEAAFRTGIPLSSYCSVARGEVFKHQLFADIGAGYGKTAAQVVLRWILQKGIPINTMSTRRENIEANFHIMDFILSSIDMERIDELAEVGYRIVDSKRVPWAPSWD